MTVDNKLVERINRLMQATRKQDSKKAIKVIMELTGHPRNIAKAMWKGNGEIVYTTKDVWNKAVDFRVEQWLKDWGGLMSELPKADLQTTQQIYDTLKNR